VLETSTLNPIPIEKEVGMSESSTFMMHKRKAPSFVEGKPTNKFAKTKIGRNKGPSPLAGKATSSILPMTAFVPILLFPLLANRPHRSIYTKIVAAAISTLAHYNMFFTK